MGQIAFLYRTNACSLVWERALRQARVSYRLIGSVSFFSRKEVKLALTVLKAISNPRDTISFLTSCSDCCQGFGEKSVRDLLAASQDQGIPAEEAARSLSGKPKLKKFLLHLDEARQKLPFEGLLHLLHSTGAWEELKQESTPDNDRCENVNTLCADLREFLSKGSTLHDYLLQAALASASDIDSNPKAVNLLTIHAAKGLEFQVVIVSHLVDGILPHNFSLTDANPHDAIEEERRLLYVAMTRARKLLVLAHFDYGQYARFVPSRFIQELL
jgi:DNA helicase-2/ATP-dependent DNA helicase PcrA